MADGFKLEGFAELERNLAELPSKIAKGAIRKGTRNAAKKVLRKAQQKVPVRTGNLAKQLKEWPAKKQKKGSYKVVVGVKRMTAKRRKKIGTKQAEDEVARAAYSTPVEYGTYKMRARPFLRPALSTAGPGAMAEMKPDIIAEAQRLLDKGRA